MSDLLITLIAPLPDRPAAHADHRRVAQHAAGHAKTVLVTFASVAILALTVVRLVKSGFAVGSMIMVGVVAALALWLTAGGGIDTISVLFGEQAKAK